MDEKEDRAVWVIGADGDATLYSDPQTPALREMADHLERNFVVFIGSSTEHFYTHVDAPVHFVAEFAGGALVIKMKGGDEPVAAFATNAWVRLISGDVEKGSPSQPPA